MPDTAVDYKAKIRKVLDCEVKQIEGREKGSKAFRFVASDPEADRVGDTIQVEGWQLGNFLKNPVIQWAHDGSIPAIGIANKIYKNRNAKNLVSDIEFASDVHPLAKLVEDLVDKGFIKAVSVGFRPIEWNEIEDEKSDSFWPSYNFTKSELLEISLCNVPMHPGALVESSAEQLALMKSFGMRIGTKEDQEGFFRKSPTSIFVFRDAEEVDTSTKQNFGINLSENDFTLHAVEFSAEEFKKVQEAQDWLKAHDLSPLNLEEEDGTFKSIIVEADKFTSIEDFQKFAVDTGVEATFGSLKGKGKPKDDDDDDDSDDDDDDDDDKSAADITGQGDQLADELAALFTSSDDDDDDKEAFQGVLKTIADNTEKNTEAITELCDVVRGLSSLVESVAPGDDVLPDPDKLSEGCAAEKYLKEATDASEEILELFNKTVNSEE